MSVAGRLAWTVATDVVGELSLRVGTRVTAPMAERLDQGADAEAALRAGLRMLERRGHARQELARKLLHKGHAEAAVEHAIGHLADLGLLDESAFAESFVTLRAAQGRGSDRLRRDLRHLGVAPEVVTAALATLAGPAGPDPWQRTLAQARRRAESVRGLPRQVQLRRLSGFFARRGFTGPEVQATIRRIIAEPSDTRADD